MERIKKSDHQNNIFYQVPKFLFLDEFKKLSNNAKILYSMLKERHELSVKNNWIDDEGNIYYVMVQESMAKALGVSVRTITTIIETLVNADLIQNVRMGHNKPNRLYLLMVNYDGISLDKSKSRRRYNFTDVINQQFIQVPKFLFEGEFKTLSNDARILYGVLKDRNALSIQNNFVNEYDEIYLTYSRVEMGEMVGSSKPTIIKALNSLIAFNLLEEERMGLSRLNRIYLSQISNLTYNHKEVYFKNRMKTVKPNFENLKKHQISLYKLHIPRGKDIACPEVKNLRIQRSINCVSRGKDIAYQEVKNLRTSNTDVSNTVLSNTDMNKTDIKPINQKSSEKDEVTDRYAHNTSTNKRSIKEVGEVRFEYYEQIKFYDLASKYISLGRDNELHGLVEIIIETLMTHPKDELQLINIGKHQKPLNYVKDILYSLQSQHIDYVMESLGKTTQKINNIRQYTLTAVLNSYATLDLNQSSNLRYLEN